MAGNPRLIVITSEGCVDIFGTRYLLLKVNDFQSNRVTGGMVSLTDNQNKFKLPKLLYRKSTGLLMPILLDRCKWNNQF